MRFETGQREKRFETGRREQKWRGEYPPGVDEEGSDSTPRPFLHREERVETGGVGFNRKERGGRSGVTKSEVRRCD